MIIKSEQNNLKSLILELGKEIERLKSRDISYKTKQDLSPLTEADILVNNELNKFIKKTKFKNIISEENKQIKFSDRKNWNFYWLIDPIDGTKEYMNQGNDYTINVALCKKNEPIFSIVYAPAYDDMYFAKKDLGAYKNHKKICVKSNINSELNLVASKSHPDIKTLEFIRKLEEKRIIRTVTYGSSLKICKIAEGIADIYPRLSDTMEWDTCAAHLVLNEAGGSLFNLKNKELTYNKKTLINDRFIASSSNLRKIISEDGVLLESAL